jgi:hypothetical protein
MCEHTQAFLANPYRFMEKNIVITGDNPKVNEVQVNGSYRVVSVSVKLQDGSKVLKKGNETEGKVFNLRFNAPTDPVTAYWCPYQENSDGDAVMLGNDANYMFTVTMNACSLGIGSQTDGVVRVAHANYGNAGGTGTPLDQLRNMDQAQLAGLQRNDVAVSVISPLSYVLNSEGQVDRKRKSTTFGMHRTNHAWAFFTLKYMYMGGGYGNGRYEHLGIDYAIGGRWGTW